MEISTPTPDGITKIVFTFPSKLENQMKYIKQCFKVDIQGHFILVSGVQHSGQTIISSTN